MRGCMYMGIVLFELERGSWVKRARQTGPGDVKICRFFVDDTATATLMVCFSRLVTKGVDHHPTSRTSPSDSVLYLPAP